MISHESQCLDQTAGHCQAFSRQNRLIHAQDYRGIFDGTRKLVHRYFLVVLRANRCSHSRLGLIISKKNVRKSTQRNTIKRVIRESFRYHQHLLIGLDVIVIAKKDLATLSKAEFRHKLDYYWKKSCKKLL